MFLKLYLVILASSLSASVEQHPPDSCRENEWMCSDGSCISSRFQCDGEVDCRDRSDENIEVCVSIYMRSLAIISKLVGASLKQNPLSKNSSTKAIENLNEVRFNTAFSQRQQTTCELPEYPAFGTYHTNIPNAKPGEAYDSVTIDVICKNGYGVNRPGEVKCQNGVWLAQIPNCVSQCHLPSHPSVEYRCLVSGAVKGTRNCTEYEPVGTLVSPKCRLHFYSPIPITMYMRCNIHGQWDNAAKCIPECGTVTAEGTGYIYGGRTAKKAEVPWHAGIYTKTKKPYEQICGGSLISSNVVISAAHCFWDEEMGQLPTTDYAVAVGKLYRPWADSMDEAQQSDVKEIHLPEHFQGRKAHLQSDLAVMLTRIPFKFNGFIRPVCVDFDYNFDRIQLESGMKGKVAGWGLTNGTGKESPVLKVIELPYVSIGQCRKDLSETFHGYMTNDKICAGFNQTGQAVCKGDSGGGLAFPAPEKDKKRYYLRGIVSSAPTTDDYSTCNAYTYTGFTQILFHKHFIMEFWTADDVSSTDTSPIRSEDDFSYSQDIEHVEVIKNICILPPYPDHGTYATNIADARPGGAFKSVVINISCQHYYEVNGSSSVNCLNGNWSETFPKCVFSEPNKGPVAYDPCNPSPCGPGALCSKGICECESGLQGNPFVGCWPKCLANSDCSTSHACVLLQCVDPCVGSCGVGAACRVINHFPICACLPGTTGDPFFVCNVVIAVSEPYNPCNPSPCGPGAHCSVNATGTTCECESGLRGDPHVSCLVADTSYVTCLYNSDCLNARACVNSHCIDPCLRTCGVGADCRGVDHLPVCSCPPGTTGNTFVECRRIAELQPVALNPCNPSPCGPGTVCRTTGEHASCACKSGLRGNPAVGCGPECLAHSDCPTSRACKHSHCTDPCWEQGTCGVGADCRVVNHTPVCSCPPGTTGNAFLECKVRKSQCGKVTIDSTGITDEGMLAAQRVPWHAGIYNKTERQNTLICGGSLISNNVVLSAANCFWADGADGGRPLPASNYAVAVGNNNRYSNDSNDGLQRSDVQSIHLPERYQGNASDFQADIAVVIVKTPFKYTLSVQPVCLDFDFWYEKRQLQPGVRGTMAVWHRSGDSNSSQVLQVVNLPYVSVAKCISESPLEFRGFITSDKICTDSSAGYTNGSESLCIGNSGSGLAYSETYADQQRFYIRGILSKSPNNRSCSTPNSLLTFTQILKYEHFIKQFWQDADDGDE